MKRIKIKTKPQLKFLLNHLKSQSRWRKLKKLKLKRLKRLCKKKLKRLFKKRYSLPLSSKKLH